MAQSVIFLDFDGVLNSREFAKRATPEELELNLDRCAVAQLNDLVKRASAVVVLSTAWRVGTPVSTLRKYLVQAGFRYSNKVIGKTPDFFDEPRGEEIAWWRSQFPQYGRLPFVILDDLEDMAHLKPYLVRTDPKVGLIKEDVELAIQLLRAQRVAA